MSEGRRDWKFVAGRLGLEFGIVVFGVFVALWADARVTARGESRVEATRLEALHLDVVAARDSLAGYRQELRGGTDLLEGVASAEIVESWSAEELRNVVGMGLLGGLVSFDPQLDALDDLRFSGELTLLEGGARQAASALDASLRRLAENQEDLMAVQHLNFDPFALARVDLGDVLDVPGGAAGPGDSDLRELARTREFRNLVRFRIDLQQQILQAARRLESDLEAAEVAIAGRLAELGRPVR